MSDIFQSFEQFFSHGSDAIVVLFFVLIHFISEPLRWSIYISHTNMSNFSTLLKVFSLTALGSYILPFKLGIPLRIYLLNKKTNLNFPIISALLLVDGLSYYLFWVISGCIGFMYLYGAKLLAQQIHFSAAILVAIVATLFFYLSKDFFRKKISKLSEKLRYLKESKKFFSQISYQKFLIILVITGLDIGSHILRHLFLFYMLGIDLSLAQVASITTLSVMTGLLSMMPMGLIGYDATIIFLLQQSGISLEAALLIPLLNRFASLILSFILGAWGGVSMGVNPISGLKKMASSINKN